jgi:hypothetical protein
MPDNLEKSIPCLYEDDTQISSSDNYDTLIENLNLDLNNIHKGFLIDNKLQHKSEF